MVNSAFPKVAGVVFGVIAALQACRAVVQIPIQVGSFAVPVGVSWAAAVVMGSLCLWGMRAGQ